jgi:transcriptional regulator with XRE-family HTH domain
MSIAVRRALAVQLQECRLAARKSVADVAETGIVARSTLQSIEAAERPIKVSNVIALCEFYGVDSETKQQFVKMAMTKEPGWWEAYKDVLNTRFRFYLQLEVAASSAITYDAELLYGLLQTPAYHRALIEADPYATSADSAEREIKLRQERQQATLGRTPTPLQIRTVINEAVLLREIGGPAVMAELRDHLLQLNQRPNIELTVLPWAAGAHAAIGSAFQVVSFDQPHNPSVAYMENLSGVLYTEEADAVGQFVNRFDLVALQSIPIEEYFQ